MTTPSHLGAITAASITLPRGGASIITLSYDSRSSSIRSVKSSPFSSSVGLGESGPVTIISIPGTLVSHTTSLIFA